MLVPGVPVPHLVPLVPAHRRPPAQIFPRHHARHHHLHNRSLVTLLVKGHHRTATQRMLTRDASAVVWRRACAAEIIIVAALNGICFAWNRLQALIAIPNADFKRQSSTDLLGRLPETFRLYRVSNASMKMPRQVRVRRT